MRCAKHKGCPRTTERKEETKKEARDAKDKMPAREPIRMRRAKAWLASVSAALRRLHDGFSATAWGGGARRGRHDGVGAAAVAQTFRRYRAREPWGLPREPLARASRAQAPRVPRQVPAARQDLRVRERRRPQVDDHDPVDFRTHERKTKTHSEV